MKTKITATLLAFVLLMAILPAKPILATANHPHLIPSINIHFSEDVFVTLTNVYEFYAPFGYRMSIYMGEGGTIMFNGIDGPDHYALGTLYAGKTFTFEELSPEGWGAASFNIGRCRTTSNLVWPYYMGLVGGTYQWVAQIMLNQYVDFQAHTAALEQYGRYSLFRHTWQQDSQVTEPMQAALIPSITIRPPEMLPNCSMTITFTNVYDTIDRADIAAQSQETFFLAPNGTISFNYDMTLSSMFEGGARFETIHLTAGEVFSMQGHESVSFMYGVFPVHGHHYATERHHAIVFRVVEEQEHLMLLPQHIGRLSLLDITLPRVLRFEIGAEFFTDRGQYRWIEAAPFLAGGRTMVPLRVIAEALGAEVDFCDDTFTVHMVLDGQELILPTGVPLPNDMGTPVIISNRTFVPVRYVMDVFGATVRWCYDEYAAYVYI